MRVLADRARELLADEPPYLQDPTESQAVLGALGRELQLVDDAAGRLRSKFLPHRADDEFRTLGMWELLLGLPVEPPDATVAQRRSAVLSRLLSRNSPAGIDWITKLRTLLGTNDWTAVENNDYSVTLDIPSVAGGYVAQVVARVAGEITPAHLLVRLQFGEGWLVGSSFDDPNASRVGIDLL